MTDFVPLPLRAGRLYGDDDVDVWGVDGPVEVAADTAWLLTVAPTVLDDGTPLDAGCWAVRPGGIGVRAGAGMVLAQRGYVGLRQAGGPVEPTGRLRYIDGCTDTLLVCPPRLGEACLNHLHLPPGTDQSQHTHPSARVGVIVRGAGFCRTPGGRWPLSPALGWYIPAGARHSFQTFDASLDVLAWHPDSDFGPTDEDHPMINRTWR